MKFAKSCKIFLLAVVTALMIATTFMFTGVSAYAEDVVTQGTVNYFGVSNATVEYKDSNLVATLQNDSQLKFKNQLAVNSLEFETLLSSGVKKVTVTLEYKSYYENGVAKDFSASEVTLDKEIKSVLEISVGASDYTVDFNGEIATVAKADGLTLAFSTTANVLSAKVEGTTITSTNDYYKIAGKDKNVATITFAFETETADSTFTVVYVDQMSNATGSYAGKYKQTFVLNDEGKIKDYAYPVVSIADNIINTSVKELRVISSKKVTVTMNAYSVFASVENNELFLTKVNEGVNGGNIALQNAETPKYAYFNKSEDVAVDTMTFGVASKVSEVGDVVYGEYNVNVVDEEGTDVAPLYNVVDDGTGKKIAKDQTAYKAFLVALENALDGIRLGDDVTIPSFNGLISDDATPYGNLTHTIYYKTPTNDSGSTTGWTFKISDAGDYLFYVVFKDEDGNAIDTDKFFVVDEDDENTYTYGEYENFVFKFNVQDDEAFTVSEADATEMGKGYLNVKYKFKPFDIDASKYNTSYALYYNANVDATADDEGWVLVEAGDNFTEEEVNQIAYDGQRTFIPTKVGAYMVECTVVSTNEVKSAKASTIVKIENEPQFVKPDNQWFQKNIAPLTFLFVGTVCLVILLVLIFKKPEEIEEPKVDTKK